MAEITRERREEYRHAVEQLLSTPGVLPCIVIGGADLLSLLDAADERDRLREELRRAVSMFDRDHIKGYRLLGKRTNAATE